MAGSHDQKANSFGITFIFLAAILLLCANPNIMDRGKAGATTKKNTPNEEALPVRAAWGLSKKLKPLNYEPTPQPPHPSHSSTP